MLVTLKDKMKDLSPAQRKKIEARAAELIAQEMTLRELGYPQAHAGKDGQDAPGQPGQCFAARKT